VFPRGLDEVEVVFVLRLVIAMISTSSMLHSVLFRILWVVNS